MIIIAGVQKDNEQGQKSSVPYESDNLAFLAIIADLTNSTFIDKTGDDMKVFLQSEEGKKTQQMKKDLLNKDVAA